MDKNEFEYNYYFELYKEKSVLGHEAFKGKFKKHHKTNIDIQKLIYDIEKYQIKKYGIIKFSDWLVPITDKQRTKDNDRTKMYNKYGTKEERMKKREKYKKGIKE